MGNQTTFSTESAGSKAASSVSEVMRTPKNMFLLAETGVFMERLQAITQAANHTLNILQRARNGGGIPLPHFTKMLCKEVNAGETLLNRCQKKVNELVDLHSDSCSNAHIQKLVDKLSICKKEVVNVRETSKHFLPVSRTEPQMLQSSQDPAKSTVQHIKRAKDMREYRGSSFKRGSNRILVHLPPAPAKDKRESTTAPRGSGRSQRRSSGKRSDRGSSFEKSSNGILVHLPPGTKPVSSALFGPSELGNDHNNQLFPESDISRINKIKHRSEPSITHLFNEMSPSPLVQHTDSHQGTDGVEDSCGGDTSVYYGLSHLFCDVYGPQLGPGIHKHKQGMQSIAPPAPSPLDKHTDSHQGTDGVEEFEKVNKWYNKM